MRCDSVVTVFVITALWDVVLRLFAERRVRALGIENWSWVATLRPYFARHTVLGAALIAGFVGAIAYAIISSVDTEPWPLALRILWVALISALVGIPMRHSGLFPHLKRFYYDPLPFATTFASDAFSGVLVGASFMALSEVRARTG